MLYLLIYCRFIVYALFQSRCGSYGSGRNSMRIFGFLIVCIAILALIRCSDDSPVEVDDPAIPVITSPASGTTVDRLKVTIRGHGEPGVSLHVMVDRSSNVVGTVSTDQQGDFILRDAAIGGSGSHAIWARMASDTTVIGEPVVITTDFSTADAPVVLFPPHGSRIPAQQTPVAGMIPEGIVSVEIYRGGALAATTDVEDGLFFWSGLEPSGSGELLLWARGRFGDGGFSAYGESIQVSTGGGESPYVMSMLSPLDNELVRDSEISVSGTAQGSGILSLILDGGKTGFETTISGGSFSFDPLPIHLEGSHLISIISERSTGEIAEFSSRVRIDRTAPLAPVILSPENSALYRTLEIPVSGASEPGATVFLSVNDAVTESLEVSENGSFSYTLTMPSQGEYTIGAVARDEAGNMSSAETECSISIDLSAPGAPALTEPRNDSLLVDGSVSISGTADVSAWLEIRIDTRVEEQMYVGSSGSFQITVDTPTPDGTHWISVRAASEPGAYWVPGDSIRIFTDQSAPAIPALLQPAESSYVSGETFFVMGSSESRATVEISLDETLQGQVTADADGIWSSFVAVPDEDGGFVLQVTAIDTAGFSSGMSDPYLFYADNTNPEITISEPAAGSVHTANPVTIQGETEPQAMVSIDGIVITPDVSGQFSHDVFLSEGYDTVMISASDAAGNTEEIHHPLKLDTIIPHITLTSPSDSLITQFSTITVSGTTEIGATIHANGTQIAVDQSGVFSGQVTLTLGWNQLEITARDQAGWENTITRYIAVDAAPTVPQDPSPENNTRVLTGRPILSVSASTDPNGDDLTYWIELYADQELQSPILLSPALADMSGTVMWAVRPELTLDGSTVYWRARAYDGIVYGPWSDTASFRLIDVGSRDPHRFFGYGDSITAGSQFWNGFWAEDVPTGYRPMLELALTVFLGPDVEVDYAVAGGAYTSMALDGIDEALAGENGAYLLLNIGILDARDAYNLQDAVDNIEAMVQYAMNQGFLVVVSTVTPIANNNDANNRVIQLNTLIRQLAQQEGYPLADLYAALEEAAFGDFVNVTSGDGLHPNDYGYSVIAEEWYRTLTGSDDYPLPFVLEQTPDIPDGTVLSFGEVKP